MRLTKEVASSIAELTLKCASITSLKCARQLHALFLTTAGAETPYSNNNLVSMYARCGSLEEARKVFDQMPLRNIVSYNALISAYARNLDYANYAFGMIPKMKFEFLMPNSSTFTSLLRACALLDDHLMGSSLHTQTIKLGFLNNIVMQTSVLGMYSSCGDIESAKRVFECMNNRDAVSWNSVISGSLKNERIGEAFKLFRRMLLSDVTPTQFTYSMILSACSKSGNYSIGKSVHAQMIISDVLADLPLENALLDMCCSYGDMKAAFYIFYRIENPNLVTWNSIISGCSENGCSEQALEMYIKLRRMSAAPKPDEFTFAAIISATWELGFFIHGKLLHGQVTKAGYEQSVFVGSTLISMYFTNEDAESAQKVFSLIKEKDVVVWTEMIVGQSRMGNEEDAIHLFVNMYQEKNGTDSFALSSVLGACSDIAVLRQGEMFHSLVIKTGFEIEMSVCGSLVDMYGKNGKYDAAESVFSHILNPDLKCWNSMLGAYGQHGMVEKALNFFQGIHEYDLRPDPVTYLSLLSVYSHSGSTQQGKSLWNQMKERGIKPGPKHYSSMVSLVSRAGLLDEAVELIKESPFNDGHVELWRTLLSACVNTRNLQMGLHVAEQILRLDPEDTATHILVSNLYAVTGKWDSVAEIRRKLRDLGSAKDPGLSWIELKNGVQVFSSGDQINPQVGVAQHELHMLKDNMCRSSNEHDSMIS